MAAGHRIVVRIVAQPFSNPEYRKPNQKNESHAKAQRNILSALASVNEGFLSLSSEFSCFVF